MIAKLRSRFDSNRYFWLGVLGAVFIVIMLILSGTFRMIGIGEKSIQMEFAQAAGIRVGDKVNVAGVPTGTVTGAELDGDHVVITANVNSNVEFGPDARAAIKMATLLGARYIDLEPGDGSGLPDDRIPLSNTAVPYNLADVIQVGTPKFEALDTEQLAESLNLVNQQLGDSPELVVQALDSVGALARVMDQRKTEVDQLLKDLDKVTQLLADNRNSVLLVITQGEAIAARVMERQELLRQLLDNVATLTRQLQQIGAENDNQLGPTLEQLETMAEGLQKNKDNLDRMLSIMPPSIRYLANAWGNGNYAEVGLPWLFPDNWLCAAQAIEGCQG